MNFQIKNILEDIKTGARKADIAQTANNLNLEGGLGYGQSILDPRFKKAVAKAAPILPVPMATF